VIAKYKQLAGFHGWLKQKKARNEPIPDTRDELMTMYRVDRPAFLMPTIHKKSYNKTQLKAQFRKKHT
jgi:hypothetical protein